MKKLFKTAVVVLLSAAMLAACGGGGGGGGVGTTPNPTYTVTYNTNGNTGGSALTDTTNYLQGQTVTVLGNTGSLVNTGYSFSGWNTLANGTGTTYVPAGTFAMGSANVTLYAKWTSGVFKMPDTYQTTCYDVSGTFINCTGTGQDGAYNINSPSYTDNGNSTITDNVTNLVWQKQDDGAARTWADAGTYCDNLTLGGQIDWRLPSQIELISLIDNALFSPDSSINTTYFPNTVSSAYWSSTSNAGYTSIAWGVNFNFGSSNNFYKTNALYARCVRGGQ